MKNIANAVLAAMLVFAAGMAIADDTPLVQALKVEQKIKDVMEALHDVNADAQTFSQAPAAIRGITRIGDLLDGAYDGPITIKAKSAPYLYYTFHQTPGHFNIYAPNLTSLPDSAFREATGIDTFYAPELASIGAYAFDMGSDDTHYAPGIRNALFPKCTYVGTYAFDQCRELTNAVLNTTAINQNYAFNLCAKLRTLDTPPLTSIGYYSLNHCEKLKSLNLSPTSVSFGEYACRNCYSLEITNWPASVSLSQYCFAGCRSITNVNELLGRWTSIGTVGMFQDCKGLTELKSDNITAINANYVFDECIGVTNISFPNLTAIAANSPANQAFDSMTSLKTVSMPKLETIGLYNSYDSSDYCMASWTSIEELEFPELTQVGWSYGGRAEYTWRNNYSMRRFSAPKLHTIYGNSNFSYCSRLKELNLPALNLLSQGYVRDPGSESMFFNCASMEEISLPELTTIYAAKALFSNCFSLKKVFMPKLKNIYQYDSANNKNMQYMFCWCPRLRDVTFGFTAAELLAYPGFASLEYYSAPAANVVFHCPAEAPFNVDVMYVDGAWKAVTNGTFRLAEWIKGTGAQYVSTGYIHGTNTQVEVDFSLLASASPKQYEYVFGARKNSDTVNSFAALSRWNNAYKFGWMRNDTVQSGAIDISEEVRYRMVCCTNSMEVYDTNGGLLYSLQTTAQPNEGVGPLMVFTANNSTSKGGLAANTYMNTCMKLYRFTIKEEGETVMDLVPGVVGVGESEIPCLLDAADGYHPLFNAGTDSFEIGAVTNSVQVFQEEP